MRGLRAPKRNWCWHFRRGQIIHGAAVLAVLPLRSEQPWDDSKPAGTNDRHLLTTPLRQTPLPTLCVEGTPITVTTSPINPWILGNVAQHHESDGVSGIQICQKQTTTSSATDPEVPFPPSGNILFCSRHLGEASTSATASGEQWSVSTGPANDASVLNSSEQQMSSGTTDDVSPRGIATEHSAFQRNVEANTNLLPEVRQAGRQMTLQAPLLAFASRKRCAEEEPDSEPPKSLRIEEVARLLFEEPDQSVEILEDLMQSIDTEGQGHTWKASKPRCNPTHLTTTYGGSQPCEGGLVPNLSGFVSQAGIVAQASSSDDQRGSITNSITALKSPQSMQMEQAVAQSPQDSAKSLPPLYQLIDQCFDNVGKEREQPSSERSGTMGYVQDFDESGSCWLYPVSYADHPEALPFDHFLTPGVIQQIVLPRDPSRYLEALYDSMKQFEKLFITDLDDIGNGTKQQHGVTKRDTVDYFRIIRARCTREYTARYWAGLIKRVKGWLRERSAGPRDDFAHFAIDYFKTVDEWHFVSNQARRCKRMVDAWCAKHQGLSKALRLVATQNHAFMRGRFVTTLPDIYTRTCPYFLMYALHHRDPRWSNEPGTSTGHSDIRVVINHRARLLHELTNAVYIWQMVLYVRGKAERPEWPSEPRITRIVKQEEQREDDVDEAPQSDAEVSEMEEAKCKGRNLEGTIILIFNKPLCLGRFEAKLLTQIQAIESRVTAAPLSRNAPDLYNAVGSFTDADAAPIDRGSSTRHTKLADNEPLKSFWRLRRLFHANTCRILRYQIDKLVMETEGKMNSGLLPDDPFLRFACDYLRVMRTWDSLNVTLNASKNSLEVTKGLVTRVCDMYKITDAVKKVAKMEKESEGHRLLPEIYKTYPASSLLPYVTWWDTEIPKAIAHKLRMEGVTHGLPVKASDKCLKAVMSRLLTIIAEIWDLRAS